MSLKGNLASLSTDSPNKKRQRLSGGMEEHNAFGFEHLDHPADIQLHAWGKTMERAMEQLILSMYSYLVDDPKLSTVDEVYEYYFEASGRDLDTLIFALLDEVLVVFQSEPFFIGKKVVVDSIDLKNFVVKYHAVGESYEIDKHKQGTDVKAITYSNMQIIQKEDRSDLYVIIDI